jgi:predicted  nucleic acid-binding Zn-ribbon protein
MMRVAAQTLRTIHRIHRQLAELRSRLERGPKQVKAGEANVARLQTEWETARQIVTRTRMAADQKELQLREREQRIEAVRIKLNSAGTNREYQAFLEQIAADEQANSVLSDEILELFDKITELQQAAKKKAHELEQTEADLGKVMQRVSDQRAGLEADVGRLQQELAEVEKELPAEVYPEYQRIVGARGEDGMAQLEGDCCGGCFQTVTPQTVNELLMEKLVFCKSCGCLLYLTEDREPKRHE